MNDETIQAGIVPTSISGAVSDAFTFAVQFRRAAAVTGAAGIGKSTALRHLAQTNPRAVYGVAREFRSLQNLLKFLVSGFQMWVPSARSNSNLRDIIRENMPLLVESGAVLLIDEMQDLTLDAMREVVGYSEEHRLPIVLVGNERSLRVRPRMDTYTFDQILSRISKITRLKPPTEIDYAEFAKAHGIDDAKALAAAAAYGQRTSFRALRDLLAVVTEMAVAGPITLDLVKAGLMLITGEGAGGAARLLQPVSKSA